MDRVADHYAGANDVVAAIAASLKAAGKDLAHLTTADLASVDEFHIRGREATLELAGWLAPGPETRVLDIGSGLGGPTRTLAETTGCRVTGIDLTPAFAAAATALSQWVGLADRLDFVVGDATALPFPDASFDAALSVHVSMNIADKARLYREARRVLRPGARFAIYEVLAGEGGELRFPVPWAREPSISHLVKPEEMQALLEAAGLRVARVEDSTGRSQAWFEAMAARLASGTSPAVTFQAFLGNDFPAMAKNQVLNLRERRIRTVSYVCEA